MCGPRPTPAQVVKTTLTNPGRVYQTMPTFFCPSETDFDITLFVLILLVASCTSICPRKEVKVFSTSPHRYKSAAQEEHGSGTQQGYNIDGYCEVVFRASQEGDVVRIQVIESHLETRTPGTKGCPDLTAVFDGPSVVYPFLGDFCGNEVPVFESSGSTLLLVFKAKKFSEDFRGFILDYSSQHRPEHKAETSWPSFGADTIVPAVIVAAVLYCILFLVLYKKCKTVCTARHSFAAASHTSDGHRENGVTVQNQTSHAPPAAQVQGQRYTNGSHVQPDIIISLTALDGPGIHDQLKRGRVRHPAGDSHRRQLLQPTPLLLCSGEHDPLNDCSGYGSDRDEPSGDERRRYVFPVFPPDPRGVFYAGSVDEHGVLHPPGEQNQQLTSSFPSMMSTSHAHNHTTQQLEGDRRSRESNHSCRSLHPSGRNSPWESGSGRGSPMMQGGAYRGSPQLTANLDSGQTITFYGMIDSVSAVSDSGRGYSSGDQGAGSSNMYDPPPSYVEATTGKYSPHSMKH